MVHHCPRCELRFASEPELTEHLTLDHDAAPQAWERYRYPQAHRHPPLYAEDVEQPSEAPRRYLVVANQTLGDDALSAHLRALVEQGPCSFYVLVPATSVADYPLGALTFAGPVAGRRTDREVAEGAAQARFRLRQAIEFLRDVGAEAHGGIGAPDPYHAVQQVLRRERFDGIVVSTLPSGLSRWLRMDLPRRLERTANVPVTTVVARAPA